MLNKILTGYRIIYDLCLAVILIWRFGSVVPEPPIIMSAKNNGETAPWPYFYKFNRVEANAK